MRVDLRDAGRVAEVVSEVRPTAIVNLAGFASVGKSFAAPIECFELNVTGAIAIVAAARGLVDMPYILAISSGEVYGEVPAARLPATERTQPSPRSPYAASKLAMEAACASFPESVDDIGIARSFNHTGPGQPADFAIPQFARQILAAKAAGESSLLLDVGDLSVARDFLDVRDVAAAYCSMIENRLKGTFNVCSGTPRRLADVLGLLATLAGVSVEPHIDPARLRPGEPPIAFGSAAALAAATGWSPAISFETTLSDLLADHQEETE
jgi:GDP-4-dehydro-6-deoxy-D-mannose reductase